MIDNNQTDIFYRFSHGVSINYLMWTRWLHLRIAGIDFNLQNVKIMLTCKKKSHQKIIRNASAFPKLLIEGICWEIVLSGLRTTGWPSTQNSSSLPRCRFCSTGPTWTYHAACFISRYLQQSHYSSRKHPQKKKPEFQRMSPFSTEPGSSHSPIATSSHKGC